MLCVAIQPTRAQLHERTRASRVAHCNQRHSGGHTPVRCGPMQRCAQSPAAHQCTAPAPFRPSARLLRNTLSPLSSMLHERAAVEQRTLSCCDWRSNTNSSHHHRILNPSSNVPPCSACTVNTSSAGRARARLQMACTVLPGSSTSSRTLTCSCRSGGWLRAHSHGAFAPPVLAWCVRLSSLRHATRAGAV